jgi:large subunit ribosomal protein L13
MKNTETTKHVAQKEEGSKKDWVVQTWNAKKEEAERNWWVIDASGLRLGRLATQVATLLRGKHKPTFTPHVDNGDFVVVINIDKIELTGTKWDEKKYYRHSRFFGSLKEKTAKLKKQEDPAFLIKAAVKGMLPDNRLSYSLLGKLNAYAGPNHPHAAQKPQAFVVKKHS